MARTHAEAASVTVKKTGKGKMKAKIRHMTIEPSDNGGFSTTTAYHPSTEAEKKEPWAMPEEKNVHATPADMHAHVQAMFPAAADNTGTGDATPPTEPDGDEGE